MYKPFCTQIREETLNSSAKFEPPHGKTNNLGENKGADQLRSNEAAHFDEFKLKKQKAALAYTAT